MEDKIVCISHNLFVDLMVGRHFTHPLTNKDDIWHPTLNFLQADSSGHNEPGGPTGKAPLEGLPFLSIDEAHRAFGDRFQEALSKLRPETFRWLLSGTSVVNHPSDMLFLLKHLTTNKKTFEQEFDHVFQNLSDRIRSTIPQFYLCRDRKKLPDLAPFLDVTVWLNQDPDHRSLYLELYDLMIKSLKDEAQDKGEAAGLDDAQIKKKVARAPRGGTLTMTTLLNGFDLSKQEFQLRRDRSNRFEAVLKDFEKKNKEKLQKLDVSTLLTTGAGPFLIFDFLTLTRFFCSYRGVPRRSSWKTRSIIGTARASRSSSPARVRTNSSASTRSSRRSIRCRTPS